MKSLPYILAGFVLCLTTLNLSTLVFAEGTDFRPAIALGGTKAVKKGSWGELIIRGTAKFEEKTGIPVYKTYVLKTDDYIDAIARLAEEGYNPILLTTSSPESREQLEQIIDQYPDRHFILTNGTYTIPNAYFIVFAYQETSFLAGYLAGRKSQTGKVGFIGGVDIPIIRDYLCGYIKGVNHADPDVEVLFDFVGEGFKGWNDRPRAAELANAQINKGADILYTAAGPSGVGALEAAHRRGKLGIGVDQNQNGLYPGSVLTSTQVHVDQTIFRALMASYHNVWGEQLKLFGIQEGALELAFDEHNAALIAPDLKRDLLLIQEAIVLNRIKLPRYTEHEPCVLDGNLLF